jgi:hypothetical protein
MRNLYVSSPALIAALCLSGCGGSNGPGVPANPNFRAFTVKAHVITVTDDHGNLLSPVHAGDPFTVTFSFDKTVTDTQAGDPTLAFYDFYGSANTLVAQVGQTRFSTNAATSTDMAFEITVTQANAFNPDMYEVYTQGHMAHNLTGIWRNVEVHLGLEDPTKTANASDALPLIAPNVARFTSRYVQLSAENESGNTITVGAQIDEIAAN